MSLVPSNDILCPTFQTGGYKYRYKVLKKLLGESLKIQIKLIKTETTGRTIEESLYNTSNKTVKGITVFK